ncbi:hypothetical protein GYA54_02570 [Candidatus Kuenenbacteria bacterium]|nr:hypothetical protein [Candidatus Kuenenbacteria bacterium]
MKKRLFFILISFALIFLLFGQVNAQTRKKVNIYFFWQQGCPHCATEKPFLEDLVKQNPQLELRSFDIGSSHESIELLADIGRRLNINIQGVPFTLIGERYFIGWHKESTTGASIKQAVDLALVLPCLDIVREIEIKEDILLDKPEEGECQQKGGVTILPAEIKLPLLGEVALENISLPLLTIVMGALDGFNPCAMWTLLFLISLLLGMKNRKRMWLLGVAFIFTSALVYFLFMSAWLNLILFLGFVTWVRVIIGALAFFGGVYNLKEFLLNKDSGCKVADDEKRQKVFKKIKNIIGQNSLWLAIGGIIALALLVNLAELVCSAGLPAVYTQVLALTELSKTQYYFYILLYIFFFMLDDLFIFFVAMITLEMTGITTKYTKYSKLIGGLLMLLIGLLLIFKPQWLMFG